MVDTIGDKKMEKTQEKKSVDIMNLTDSEMEIASDFCNRLYKEDKALWDRSFELVKKLSLGGLWRGNDTAIMIVARTLVTERFQLIPLSKYVQDSYNEHLVTEVVRQAEDDAEVVGGDE
jgi:hypothetical protein